MSAGHPPFCKMEKAISRIAIFMKAQYLSLYELGYWAFLWFDHIFRQQQFAVKRYISCCAALAVSNYGENSR